MAHLRQWKACGDVQGFRVWHEPGASAAMASLADYVQAALTLNYNQRKVG